MDSQRLKFVLDWWTKSSNLAVGLGTPRARSKSACSVDSFCIHFTVTLCDYWQSKLKTAYLVIVDQEIYKIVKKVTGVAPTVVCVYSRHQTWNVMDALEAIASWAHVKAKMPTRKISVDFFYFIGCALESQLEFLSQFPNNLTP